MLESVAVAIFVSTVLGFLSGLGIGGGSLLILWLTAVLGWAPEEARSVNLLFFLPGAALATFLRRKSIPWRKLLPAIAAGCFAAAGISSIQNRLPQQYLRKAFGCLLLYTGLRELFYKRKP